MNCKIKDRWGYYDEFVIYDFDYLNKPCIYFLIQEDEYGNKKRRKVVYVGQSKRGIKRIFEHKEKNFNTFSFIICNENELDFLEKEYIKKYEPQYNKAILIGEKRERFENTKKILKKGRTK